MIKGLYLWYTVQLYLCLILVQLGPSTGTHNPLKHSMILLNILKGLLLGLFFLTILNHENYNKVCLHHDLHRRVHLPLP